MFFYFCFIYYIDHRFYPHLATLFRSALRLTVNNWTLDDESDFHLVEPRSWCNPRKCIQCIPSLIAMGGPTLNLFNSELGKWCEITKCKPRHCPGMDVVGSLIYIVGGSLEWKRKQTGEYYNTETDQWVTIADMHTPRSNFGLVNLQGKLYAIGGYDGNFPLKYVFLVNFYFFRLACPNIFIISISSSMCMHDFRLPVIELLPYQRKYLSSIIKSVYKYFF